MFHALAQALPRDSCVCAWKNCYTIKLSFYLNLLFLPKTCFAPFCILHFFNKGDNKSRSWLKSFSLSLSSHLSLSLNLSLSFHLGASLDMGRWGKYFSLFLILCLSLSSLLPCLCLCACLCLCLWRTLEQVEWARRWGGGGSRAVEDFAGLAAPNQGSGHHISLLFFTGCFFNWPPPPEFAKCWPVSNWFQKNVRVPDWPPLMMEKSLSA